MGRCDSEGATHHTGCECHEARRDAEVERLKAEVERLQEMVRQAVAERNEDLDDLSTSRRANGRIIKERDAARDEIERLKESLSVEQRLVEELDPKARSACRTPPEGCACEGCAYHRELTKEEP